jgi:GrpB-like predicted nucleotidyltransferase (UPF0157 family)
MNQSAPGRLIQVVDYNPRWPDQFEELRKRIWPTVSDIALAFEHVGSTAVPGLAAKPVIDLDLVIPSRKCLSSIVTRLDALGYRHQGNLGIEDREAFSTPANQPAHHLYVCPTDSIALGNHLTFRDHLRAHPEDASAYSTLKKQLAQQFAHDADRYVEGKTSFILSVLTQHGFSPDGLESIRRANLV